MVHVSKFDTPLGPVTAAVEGESIVGLWLEGQKYFASTLEKEEYNKASEHKLPVFEQLKKWLDMYFTGRDPDFLLPLSPKGSPFRKDVWDILCHIPFGQLTTYGEIAKQLEKKYGKPQSAQAVGGAVGHNPISIIIPCHRVVGSNGSLTGYAGGIDKKIQLLKLEHVDTEKLLMPKEGIKQ